jgi:hypothetical protein
MPAELLGTSIADWLGVKVDTKPVASTWSEDELNALARGLGLEEHEVERHVYWLGPVNAEGGRSIYAFGSSAVFFHHSSYGAERLLREMCPDLLTT